MKRAELTHLRPWIAEPERPNSDASAWCVTAPRRYSKDKRQLVAQLLSEEDARIISLGPVCFGLVERILEGASMDEIQQTAQSIGRQYETRILGCCLCGGAVEDGVAVEWNADAAHAECVEATESA